MTGRWAGALVAMVGLSFAVLVPESEASGCTRNTPLLVCGPSTDDPNVREVFMTVEGSPGACRWRAFIGDAPPLPTSGEGATVNDLDPFCIKSEGDLALELCEKEFACRGALDTSKGIAECDPFRALFGSHDADGHAALVNGPVVVTTADLERLVISNPPQDQGSGFLCDAGDGPAVSARLTNGARILVGFEPDDSRLCTPVPWETTQDGRQTFLTCFPTCNGRIELWEEGGRNPIVAFPLTGLQPCPRLMVPTATNWGLIGLAVVLLVGGTWLLRRRRAYAESLSLL